MDRNTVVMDVYAHRRKAQSEITVPVEQFA